MGELQDPFLVSVHLIVDPGEGKFLQRAADAVLAWVHPELQLFRVSERASVSQRPRPKQHQNGWTRPSSRRWRSSSSSRRGTAARRTF